MAVTIKDVAALAGVSPSTVSRTCKNNPSISEETKERVRKAMLELGYEPNFQASILASQGSSKTIGIVLPPATRESYENSIYLEMIRGISQYCNQRQYSSTVITGQDEDELIKAMQTMIRSGKTDGFILLFSRKEDRIIEYFCEEGIFYVLIGKPSQFVNQTIYIDNDNLMAGHDATEYLIQLGHKKIAFIGSDFKQIYSNDRKNGYQLALMQNQMDLISDYCVELTVKPETHFEPIRKLLTLPEAPTGIVVSDDILAVVVQQVCAELGMTIPENLSLVSFNNSLLSRINSPQLTSIDINAYQLGMEAASQMIKHIENPNTPAAKSILPHTIMERKSCKRITT